MFFVDTKVSNIKKTDVAKSRIVVAESPLFYSPFLAVCFLILLSVSGVIPKNDAIKACGMRLAKTEYFD